MPRPQLAAKLTRVHCSVDCSAALQQRVAD